MGTRIGRDCTDFGLSYGLFLLQVGDRDWLRVAPIRERLTVDG